MLHVTDDLDESLDFSESPALSESLKTLLGNVLSKDQDITTAVIYALLL